MASQYTLADAGPSLGIARRPTDLDAAARSLIAELRGADALVIGVPTYNSSYPGMFKHLLDLMEPESFAGKPVILSATGGSERHTMMIDAQLRPLFNYFKAMTLPTGIFATPHDFLGDAVSAPVARRIAAAVDELAPWFQKTRHAHPSTVSRKDPGLLSRNGPPERRAVSAAVVAGRSAPQGVRGL